MSVYESEFVQELREHRVAEIELPTIPGAFAGAGVFAYEFTLGFDSGFLRPAEDAIEIIGTASDGWTVVPNAQTPGQLKVVASGITELVDRGTLLNLRFDILRDITHQADVKVLGFRLNEEEGRAGTPGVGTRFGSSPSCFRFPSRDASVPDREFEKPCLACARAASSIGQLES
jgi:hypothetical protein